MRLSQWITLNGFKQREIAAQLAISQAYLSMICSDQRCPSIRLLRRIQDLTDAKVTIADFDTE